jgi:DNA-binding protein HU-beta
MEFQELVSVLADESSYTRREIRAILRLFSQAVREALADGRDVQVWGLGRFLNLPAKERSGRNPHTGERVRIPATRRVKFDPAKELRASVKASSDLFNTGVSLEQRYGLPRKRKEMKRGKVRSRDRPEQGPEGKEGGSGG